MGEDIDGNKVRACAGCQAGENQEAGLRRQRREQKRMLAIERETRRLKKERRRAHIRQVWGPDYDSYHSDSEDPEERYTWEDGHIDMIQREADQYMIASDPDHTERSPSKMNFSFLLRL